jgi:hypothetical protein
MPISEDPTVGHMEFERELEMTPEIKLPEKLHRLRAWLPAPEGL